jgi:hypothetical protein
MAKKDMSKLYDNNEPVVFNFNLSDKQVEALTTPATELFFGGKSLCLLSQ